MKDILYKWTLSPMETKLSPVLLRNSTVYFPSVNMVWVENQKKNKLESEKEAYENNQGNKIVLRLE